jgi:hypothetical protein
MTDFTRRKAMTVAMGTMAGVATAVSLSGAAAAADSDLDIFVKVSAALTGIDALKLAPDLDQKKPPGADPIGIKFEYFNQASKEPAFKDLLKIARDADGNFAAAADMIANKSTPDIKFLGRSIILAWYLGVWYPPDVLKKGTPPAPSDIKVISAAAYTQGWTWRVARAHPMGYSELRFGHWSDEPTPTKELTGKVLDKEP